MAYSLHWPATGASNTCASPAFDGRCPRTRQESFIETAWLASDDEASPLDDLIGHSITCRIAVGARAGHFGRVLPREGTID
jgi:hypothetical protein